MALMTIAARVERVARRFALILGLALTALVASAEGAAATALERSARIAEASPMPGAKIQPPLAGRTSHVKVQAKDGTVTVWIDGLPAFHREMALPADAWVGFTASTGAKTQRHVVRNVSVAPA